jgi:hypothetical protein
MIIKTFNLKDNINKKVNNDSMEGKKIWMIEFFFLKKLFNLEISQPDSCPTRV